MSSNNPEQSFTEKVGLILKSIPRGKVISYGTIAALAGVQELQDRLFIIHRADNIPWHRIINSQGKIDLNKYQWKCYSIKINLQE